ncbi:dynein axonemal assembly factor 8 isoform X2 [Apodemus sylvaticus]|uniref:dynein axonemal assembly factor 8 isoform X2 n=1 Tax=Apodemus sylvaticus TaxID=10129 RepID=UPI00224283C0|nr:dynein axonemal assembly factor 8 isoform X2 [Apodemus sylvaticus]
MTSKDKAVVSLPVSPWDAILKAAKDQLPSLDSDSSLSDGEEEEPFIFQRYQPVLIPDLTEELAEDPIGVDESGNWVTAGRSPSPEPLLVPRRLPIEPTSERMVQSGDPAHQEGRGPGWWSFPILVDAEEAHAWLESSLRSLCEPRGPQSPPWCSQGEEATLPLKGELKPEPSDFRKSAKHRALRRERRKMIERDILQKVTQAAQSPACGDQGQAAEVGPRPEATSEQSREGWPVLSLKQLEGWDLDYILQSLPGPQDSQGDSASRSAWWLADRCRDQGHSTGPSQDILLEQLALLCATQSRVHNPTWKVSADKLRDTEEQVAGIRNASAEPGVQTEQVQKIAESRKLKTEPPTVFIDLRQKEQSEPPECQSRERCCTGKSQLLQQLRAFRKGAVSPQLSATDRTGGQKTQASEDTAGSQTRRKKHLKLWAEKQNALRLGDPLETQLLPGMGQL